MGDQGEEALKDYSESFAKRERMNGKPMEFRAAKGDHWSSVPDSVRMCRVEFENIQAYESLALNRSRAYSLFLKGNDLCNLSRYDEAIKSYDQAIAADPSSVLAWNGKGAALGEAGRLEEAIECFEEAIEIDDEFYPAWENKGLLLKRWVGQRNPIQFSLSLDSWREGGDDLHRT